MIRQGEYNVFADIVKVWIHEFARVVSDRFFTTPELEVYENILREVNAFAHKKKFLVFLFTFQL